MQVAYAPRLPLNRLSRRLRSGGLTAGEHAQSEQMWTIITYLAAYIASMDEDEEDSDEEEDMLLALAALLLNWLNRYSTPSRITVSPTVAMDRQLESFSNAECWSKFRFRQ